MVAKLNQESINGGGSSECSPTSNGGGIGSCIICASDNGCSSRDAFPSPCHIG